MLSPWFCLQFLGIVSCCECREINRAVVTRSGKLDKTPAFCLSHRSGLEYQTWLTFFTPFLSFRKNFCLNCQNMILCVQIIINIFTKKNTSTFVFTIGLLPAISNLETYALCTKLLLSFWPCLFRTSSRPFIAATPVKLIQQRNYLKAASSEASKRSHSTVCGKWSSLLRKMGHWLLEQWTTLNTWTFLQVTCITPNTSCKLSVLASCFGTFGQGHQ